MFNKRYKKEVLRLNVVNSNLKTDYDKVADELYIARENNAKLVAENSSLNSLVKAQGMLISEFAEYIVELTSGKKAKKVKKIKIKKGAKHAKKSKRKHV